MASWEEMRARLAGIKLDRDEVPSGALLPGTGIPESVTRGVLNMPAPEQPDQIEMPPENVGPVVPGLEALRTMDNPFPQQSEPVALSSPRSVSGPMDQNEPGAAPTVALQHESTEASPLSNVTMEAPPQPTAAARPTVRPGMTPPELITPPEEPMPTDPSKIPMWRVRQQNERLGAKTRLVQEQAAANAAEKEDEADIIADQARRSQEAQALAERKMRQHQQMVDLAMFEQRERSQRIRDAAEDPSMLFPQRDSLSRGISNALLAISAGMGSSAAAAMLDAQLKSQSDDDKLTIERRNSYLKGLGASADAAAGEVTSYSNAALNSMQTHGALLGAQKLVLADQLAARVARMAPGNAQREGLALVMKLRDDSDALASEMAKESVDLRLKSAQASAMEMRGVGGGPGMPKGDRPQVMSYDAWLAKNNISNGGAQVNKDAYQNYLGGARIEQGVWDAKMNLYLKGGGGARTGTSGVQGSTSTQRPSGVSGVTGGPRPPGSKAPVPGAPSDEVVGPGPQAQQVRYKTDDDWFAENGVTKEDRKNYWFADGRHGNSAPPIHLSEGWDKGESNFKERVDAYRQFGDLTGRLEVIGARLKDRGIALKGLNETEFWKKYANDPDVQEARTLVFGVQQLGMKLNKMGVPSGADVDRISKGMVGDMGGLQDQIPTLKGARDRMQVASDSDWDTWAPDTQGDPRYDGMRRIPDATEGWKEEYRRRNDSQLSDEDKSKLEQEETQRTGQLATDIGTAAWTKVKPHHEEVGGTARIKNRAPAWAQVQYSTLARQQDDINVLSTEAVRLYAKKDYAGAAAKMKQVNDRRAEQLQTVKSMFKGMGGARKRSDADFGSKYGLPFKPYDLDADNWFQVREGIEQIIRSDGSILNELER